MSGADDRQLVLVVGVGRSGTSLLSGILGQLGLHIPQPEVNANATNPRGFGEPRWVVDFHTRLLKAAARDRQRRPARRLGRHRPQRGVARRRPGAATRGCAASWAGTARSSSRTRARRGSCRCGCAARATSGSRPSFVTMLRHPAETLASAQKSYGTWQTPASRAAAWLNVSLETELATRGQRRAFVRYEDLLGDWRREIDRLGASLELPLLASIDPARAAQVDAFVDPGLHRNRVRWEDLDGVPGRLQEMAEDVLAQLEGLADPGATPRRRRRRSTRRARRSASSTREAEAIAQSSITAAKRRAEPRAQAAAGAAVAARARDPPRAQALPQARAPGAAPAARIALLGSPPCRVSASSCRSTTSRRYLDECLESLAAQTFGDLEIVMVDDGSTDRSAEIAEAFAARDPRFKLVSQSNGGLSKARNTGMDVATGEFLAFADSDDVLAPNAYELLVGALDETGSDFASGNVHRLTSRGHPAGAASCRGRSPGRG